MSDRIAVFNGGRIEQIGSPVMLYEQPATRFVAGFIGEMNFLPGHIVHSEGPLAAVTVEGVTLHAANPNHLPDGAKVVVAIRPERLRTGPMTDGMLPARIVDVIYLGNARRLIVRTHGGDELTILQQASAAADVLGETAYVSYEPGHATVFAA